MKHFDLPIFLNKFYRNKNILDKKVRSCLKIIYGLNHYSILQICSLFGINMFLFSKYLFLIEWTNIFFYFKINFNFFLYNLKIQNIQNIRLVKNYRGWKHIFNLPVRGQRNHTNAKTRKKFKII